MAKTPVNSMPKTQGCKKADLKKAGSLVIVGYMDAPIRCGILLPSGNIDYKFLTVGKRGKFEIAHFDGPAQVHHIDKDYTGTLDEDFDDCMFAYETAVEPER